MHNNSTIFLCKSIFFITSNAWLKIKYIHAQATGLDARAQFVSHWYGILFTEYTYIFECHCLSYHYGQIPPYFVILDNNNDYDDNDNNNNNYNDNDYNHNNDANNDNNENNNDKNGSDSLPLTV